MVAYSVQVKFSETDSKDITDKAMGNSTRKFQIPKQILSILPLSATMVCILLSTVPYKKPADIHAIDQLSTTYNTPTKGDTRIDFSMAS